MKKAMKRTEAAILALIILASLCSCAKQDGIPSEPAETEADGMKEGYIASAIETPDWLGYIQEMTLEDGILYTAGQTAGGCAMGCYDTVNDTWTEIDYDKSDLVSDDLPNRISDYDISSLSVAEGVVWAMLEKFNPNGRDTYILRCDTKNGSQAQIIKVGFEAGGNTESTDRVFTGLFALDADRAILSDFSEKYLIDSSAQLLQNMSGMELNFGTTARNNDQLMVSWYAGEASGSRSFDPTTLRAGELTTEEPLDGISENGHWLRSGNEGLYQYDVSTNQETLLFRWLDTALSVNDAYGSPVMEDAQGCFYRCGSMLDPTNYIIKVSPGMVKDKTVLTLATLGAGSNVLDAILRFNNSNPDYKIDLRSYDNVDRLVMDITTGNGTDIIDTGMLPDSAVDGGVFADLLPYIDSDPELSRESFIQPLLNSMIKDGGLYRLTTNFTLISFEARVSQFPGREGWTVDYVEELIADRDENTPVFFWHRNQSVLLDLLCRMSTAEYIDWDSGTCRFDSEGFKQWLRFVRDIPYTDSYTDEAVLLHPDNEVTYMSAYFAKSFLQEDYVYAGFPGTSGNGSYFMELTGEGSGISVSCGISAASKYKDAAWEFMKILLKSKPLAGFPVLKEAFDAQLEARICEESSTDYYIFTSEDAEKLKELVNTTEKIVHDDDALLNLIKESTEQYFSGQKTLDEAADMIQSRVSIYVAEHR